VGVPSIQTIRLSATRTGDTFIHLLYHRPWEATTETHAQVNIWMTGATSMIELSDPTPAAVLAKESTSNDGTDPYAMLDEIKTALPASFDWRTQGIVPAVRNQGGCGSCWAFGTVGVMESAVIKGGGPMTDLSEQFLVSCNKDGWDCNGGLTATKYHYNVLGLNQSAAGAVLETSKPYTATNGSCTDVYSHPYKASGWQFITGSEWTMPTNDQLKTAIYTYGPVTAGVCADNGWNSYSGGVYNPLSNQCSGSTNHQIVLVGWDDATQSWILRNSWGSGWGESGYMRIRYDPAGTKSRVGEGTSWVRYTLPSPSFSSNFNGSSSGWIPVKGTWSIYNSQYYSSDGLASSVASSRHTGTYYNFGYTVRMRRTGACTTCPNSLIVRGKPSSLTSTYDWRPSYLFQYANNGSFSVYEITSTGTAIALKGWTTSLAIVKKDWNTLKVLINGSSMKFYINGTLVWNGSDSTLSSGSIGVSFYRDTNTGMLYVDSAVLTTIADVNPFEFEFVAPGIGLSGGNVNMAP
jgi:C1A family cysteine protease